MFSSPLQRDKIENFLMGQVSIFPPHPLSTSPLFEHTAKIQQLGTQSSRPVRGENALRSHHVPLSEE